MIDYKTMRETVAQGLNAYLGIPIIRGNQTAPAPDKPYGTYNITTLAGKNNGTWQVHDDGKERLMVKSIWSLSFLADDWDESVNHAIKAREWFEHTGRSHLAEYGITVQSTTDITNRDNILTVDYERKNGFDVVFYVFDEAQNIADTYGTIETVKTTHTTTN